VEQNTEADVHENQNGDKLQQFPNVGFCAAIREKVG
jgi:hypothetical protein